MHVAVNVAFSTGVENRRQIVRVRYAFFREFFLTGSRIRGFKSGVVSVVVYQLRNQSLQEDHFFPDICYKYTYIKYHEFFATSPCEEKKKMNILKEGSYINLKI